MKDQYLISIRLIERLHRRFLDVIKAELDRLGIEDINNVQTLILFNINEEQLTVGELTVRGYYLGSNVSYNVKKLVENDYLIQERSSHDRRMTRVRLAPKGLDLTGRISDLYQRNSEELAGKYVAEDQLRQTNQALMSLERYWSSQISYGPSFGIDGERGVVMCRPTHGPRRRSSAGPLASVDALLRLLQAVELALERFHAVLQLAHLVIQAAGLVGSDRPARPTKRHLRGGLHRLLLVTGLRRSEHAGGTLEQRHVLPVMSSNWVSGKKRPKVCSM